ncbi:MAG: methionyl-tRNA formyltransferase [Flavobacteriales bacterium]|nr:methionyl-tRNA formyltransferase [Flavobacteriales bacterium]
MKIVFFGTPSFAAKNLDFLDKKGHNIVSVISSPDKEKGRGKKITPTHVKLKALDLKIDVKTPNSLKNEEFISYLKSLEADLFIVVAFRMLPKEIWQMPNLGTINLHTSLLPNYRGAAPINRVLINGEKETGITTFFIDEKIDCGEIILQKKVELSENTTAAQLHNILMVKGSNLLHNTINLIEKNKVNSINQKHELAIKVAPKLTKELTRIDWTNEAKDIHNLIRGLSPFLSNKKNLKDVSICPSAWFNLTTENGKVLRVKLLLSRFSKQTNNKVLSIETDQKSFFKINLNKGSIYIEQLQIAGKNVVNISQFLQGNNLNEKWIIS